MSTDGHLWYGECAACGRRHMKAHMRPLYTAQRSSNPPRILCYLCRTCFCKLLDRLGMSDVGM